MSKSTPLDDRPHLPEFLGVLGLVPPITVDDVKQAYLEKAKTAHPDRGGSADEFIRLQQAFELALEYARFKAGRMQWLSQWVERYAEQETLITELRNLGGRVDVESSDSLGASIGSDFATVLDRIVAIHLEGPRVDDRTLLLLGSYRRLLSGLRTLELRKTSASSVGLAELRGFDGLRHLDLTGTAVSREAAAQLLSDLPRLQTIVLRDTGLGWWPRMSLRRKGLTVTT